MHNELLALLSFANGVLIGYVCICRLNVMTCRVLASVRVKYVALMVGSLAYGSQPILFGEWPTISGIILHFTVTVSVLTGWVRWKGGPPADTLKATRNSAAG